MGILLWLRDNHIEGRREESGYVEVFRSESYYKERRLRKGFWGKLRRNV